MSDERPRSPSSAHIRFGAEMRKLREAAQLSQTAVAARLGCTQTQVSRLEIAKRLPSKSDAEKLDQIFGLTSRQHFVNLYRRLASGRGGPSWFVGWADEIEPSALTLRSWDPLLITGLLQTESYSRAVFQQGPRTTPEKVDELVQARMQRQQILDRDRPPSLLVMMDEGVLRRQVGGAKVMRDQLAYLVELTHRPSVSIQVVDSLCLSGLLSAFMIAELPNGSDVVYVDSVAEGQVSADQDLVVSLWSRYEAIRLWAYPEHVSRTMIEDVNKTWT